MHRRNFIKLAGSFSLAGVLPGSAVLAQAADTAAANPDEVAFSEQWLFTQAQNLARAPYEAPKLQLPPELADLNGQQYNNIRYRPDANLWKDSPGAFQLQLLHTGFQYKIPVEIRMVENGIARPVKYSPSMFDFAAPVQAPPPDSRAGFSGFRALAPLDRPGVMDDFLVFQGASYFRAIATAQTYGLLARGVCINTAQAAGEEFPVFRAFWIQKPAQGERQLLIYALLDGPSLTGVYKFRVEPGRPTVMEIECTLCPRRPLTHVGIAPLTSMYFYGPADATRLDDYRPAVHNSDGLLLWTGSGEWLWRPLVNPERLQYTAFSDRAPKGFGLLQRERDFRAYEDISARFGDRPSVWVEPMTDWGEGAIDLIELPTRSEIYDNIVAFWRPKTPLAETASHHFRYKLYWCWEPPVRSTEYYVAQTRVGALGKPEYRQFMIDFVSGGSCNGCNVPPFTAEVHAGEGEIRNIGVRANPARGGQRVSFEFRPKGAEQTDIRCELKQNGQPISEAWIYRWTA
jgi:glucans biosynthesis protein